MTNTTVEIVVPDIVIGSVYGENGSNLARLRQVDKLTKAQAFCSCLVAHTYSSYFS